MKKTLTNKVILFDRCIAVSIERQKKNRTGQWMLLWLEKLMRHGCIQQNNRTEDDSEYWRITTMYVQDHTTVGRCGPFEGLGTFEDPLFDRKE